MTSPALDPDSAPALRMRQRAARTIAVALVTIHVVIAWGWVRTPGAPALRPAQLHLRLNPNRASLAELQLLPGIGPKLAENIVTYRQSVSDPPAFRSAQDLDRVPRIGPKIAERLRPFLHFPQAPDDTPRQEPP